MGGVRVDFTAQLSCNCDPVAANLVSLIVRYVELEEAGVRLRE